MKVSGGCGCLIVLAILGVGFFAIFSNALRSAKEESESPEGQKRAAERAEYGSEPLFGAGIDGKLKIPAAVARAMKSDLRDPDSFEPREAIGMKKTTHQGQKCYVMQFTFVARNGFGGINNAAATVWIRDGQILELKVEGM